MLFRKNSKIDKLINDFSGFTSHQPCHANFKRIHCYSQEAKPCHVENDTKTIVCRGVRSPPLHLLTNPPTPPLLVPYPFLEFFNPPATLQHLSLSLIVSKYFNLYKTLLWTYDEDCQGVVVLSIMQGQPKQFSMRYLFRKDKTVYYQVKVLMVNRITRNMLFF